MSKTDLMILKTMFKEWVDLASRASGGHPTLGELDRHTKRLQYMITWTTNNSLQRNGQDDGEKTNETE